jgi:hypothetical protein
MGRGRHGRRRAGGGLVATIISCPAASRWSAICGVTALVLPPIALPGHLGDPLA